MFPLGIYDGNMLLGKQLSVIKVLIILTVIGCISVAQNSTAKALNFQTDLSDWYQLHISCKNNIVTITYPTDITQNLGYSAYTYLGNLYT